MSWLYSDQWASGFFDGEGCISISKRQRTVGYLEHHLSVQVSQNDKRPLLEIQKRFGGSLTVSKTKGQNLGNNIYDTERRNEMSAIANLLNKVANAQHVTADELLAAMKEWEKAQSLLGDWATYKVGDVVEIGEAHDTDRFLKQLEEQRESEIERSQIITSLQHEIASDKDALSRLLGVVKKAYLKHHFDDQSIGGDELDDALMTALCEAMGDQKFQEWLAQVNAR
jgi:chorismate mutase